MQYTQVSAFYRHFQVTSGQMTPLPGHFWSLRSRDFISCHTIASYCEVPPCRKWNVHNTPAFGLLQPLPDDFQANDVTFNHQRLCDVISCHVTATYCELQPCRSIMCSIHNFSVFYGHFQVTFSQRTSLPVTWGHMMSFPATLLPPNASYSPAGCEMHSIREFSAF